MRKPMTLDDYLKSRWVAEPLRLLDCCPNTDGGLWDAAHRGELRMQQCRGCSHIRFPPSLLCPRCLSEAAEWVRLSGRGAVFSWIAVHQSQHPAFNADTPYNVAIVESVEGPRLHTNLVDCRDDDICIGMPVEVVFDRINDEVTLPKFRRPVLM